MHAIPSRRLLGALLLSVAFAAPACGAQLEPAASLQPRVDKVQMDRLRSRILPSPLERRWEEIDWIATYTDGLRASSDQQKPLLLYVMNGHPLGCT